MSDRLLLGKKGEDIRKKIIHRPRTVRLRRDLIKIKGKRDKENDAVDSKRQNIQNDEFRCIRGITLTH